MPAEPRDTRSAGIVILTTLAVIAALYAGQELLMPVALAILFAGLARPLVRQFERAGLSAPIGSTVILVVFLGLAALGFGSLAGPVRAWVAEAPDTFAKAQERLRDLRKPIQTVTTAVQKLENGATGQSMSPPGDSAHRTGAPPAGPARPAPGGSQGNVAAIAARVFGTTTAVLAGIVEVLVLTFLLLASGDSFLSKLVRVLPLRREKREAVEIASETERVVARYMVVTALINVGQGLLVGVCMALLGLPNPTLWGLLTFCLEFIPYLGGASMVILLSLVGLATFDSIGRAFLPPLVYLAITTLQNNLVSPIAYGRRLQLNPVAVLVGVLFWYALWGIPGAFLAVPILATCKILGEHLEPLSPLAEFLGD
ncbi:MAG TPA: AI-2E family transporter [Gemmatimonadales bacterium]|nr:AI-2E family transporter [Gemmatimonadales bacterium]